MMHVNTCVQTTLLAPALGALILVAAIAIPAYCGWRKPGYSHLRHTISELGEAGSPVAVEAAIGFVSIGVLVWLFCWSRPDRLRGVTVVTAGAAARRSPRSPPCRRLPRW